MAKKPDEFMYERSHRASDTSYEIGKSTAQACLLINGGAATALLALLAKEHVDPVIWAVMPFCLGLFASGVAVGSVMMYSVMRMADEWNYFWYWMSHGEDEKKGRIAEANAKWWRSRVTACFFISMGCFLLSCTIFTSKSVSISYRSEAVSAKLSAAPKQNQ